MNAFDAFIQLVSSATLQSLAMVALSTTFSLALGFPLGLATSGGASDGNLTAAAGTPTLDGLGPHGGRAHSEEEHIDVPSLFAKCRILARFLAGDAPDSA